MQQPDNSLIMIDKKAHPVKTGWLFTIKQQQQRFNFSPGFAGEPQIDL